MVRRRALPSANRPPPTGHANRLLAALPAADYSRILPSLIVIPLKLKDFLHKPGEPIRDVYFPGGGFCSMLTVLENAVRWKLRRSGEKG
jgi:hypothetical protein